MQLLSWIVILGALVLAFFSIYAMDLSGASALRNDASNVPHSGYIFFEIPQVVDFRVMGASYFPTMKSNFIVDGISCFRDAKNMPFAQFEGLRLAELSLPARLSSTTGDAYFDLQVGMEEQALSGWKRKSAGYDDIYVPYEPGALSSGRVFHGLQASTAKIQVGFYHGWRGGGAKMIS